MEKAKLGKIVIFTPDSLDREAVENGAEKLAAIVYNKGNGDDSSVGLRIFGHHKDGRVPVRENVFHKDDVNGMAPYWESTEEEWGKTTDKGTGSTTSNGDEVEDKPLDATTYPAAKLQFSDLYAKWNGMTEDEQYSDEGQKLEGQLDKLYESIKAYEAANGEPTDDAPTGDAPTGDAPTGDAPTGDAPTGDAPTGDAPTGDAPTGDAPTGDAPTGVSETQGAAETNVDDAVGNKSIAPAADRAVADDSQNQVAAKKSTK